MTQVYDLSDPAHPVKIRDFGLPGQEPGSTGAVPTELHGPISTGPEGNRVYFGYGTNKGGFLQIVDREKLLNGPKEPTPDNLRLPEISRLAMSALNGAHTVFPMKGMPIAEFANDKDGKTRDIVMIVDEAILNECNEPRQMVWFADVTVENRPMMISSFTVPESSGSFCERGGRFGSHSSNESMAPVYYKKMAFIAFFNAGVRALDIRDPYHPKEVGYFIPSITATTDKRCVTIDGKDRCKISDPDQQCRDRRARLYLHRRPRQYGDAYSGVDRRSARCGGIAMSDCHTHRRHPEEPRACAASRRIGRKRVWPSFEARRRRRAPQDDGGMRGDGYERTCVNCC